jgi:SAM-dependent methyltransferase
VANPNNIEGHSARLDFLKKTLAPEEVGYAYVGGGKAADQDRIGFTEEEAIRRRHPLADAYVIDLGCGIGRLTRYLIDSPVARYLGTDILPEILDQARSVAAEHRNFRFALARDCRIPERDGQADIVCAFSLMTHLLDEEVFVYFRETARVLKRGGVAAFSFLDYSLPAHQAKFIKYVASYKAKRDLLKHFEKPTLRTFASLVGLEVIEIVDAQTPFGISGERTHLLGGNPAPPHVQLGQSLIYLRNP